jgi:hypothetical protein
MRRFCALVLVAMLIGVVPVLAATVDITIPIETIIRGAAGSEHVLDIVDVPAESQGEVCRVAVVARNQDSEHPNSDLLISSVNEVEVLDVENTAYGTVFSEGEITLGETITVTLTLGADRVFSAGLDVEIDCPPFNPTTTTTTTDTSGVSGDTTDTSGVSGDTTVTSGVSGDTTVTDSPGGGTDTSAAGETTTTGRSDVLGTSITAPGASVAGSSETLPFTGITDGNIGGVAFALVALGGLLVLSIRRRESDVIVAQEWQQRVDFYDIDF